jgi:tetratricopeptide (TPR) repeat protein
MGQGEDRQLAVRTYSGMGEVLNWMGRHPEAVQAYQAMFVAAEASGDVAAQAAAWHGISESQMQRGEPRAALESAQREEEIARKAGLELGLAKALWMKAWGLMSLGKIAEALEIAPEVVRLSERAGDRGQMAHSFNLQGVLFLLSGEYAKATEEFNQALDIFRELGNRRRAMPILNNLGVIAEARGDFRSAFEQYQEALDISREIGNRNGEVVYLGNMGSAQVGCEDFKGAEENLRLAIYLSGEAGSYVLSAIYSRLAEALVEQGEPGEAFGFARQALDLGGQNESQEDIALAWRVFGLIAASKARPVQLDGVGGGQPEEYSAPACFSRSQAIYREIGRDEEMARTMRAWARYELDHGERAVGEKMWQEAREIFERLGAEPEALAMKDLPPPK